MLFYLAILEIIWPLPVIRWLLRAINLDYVESECNRIGMGLWSLVIELSRKYFVGERARGPGNFARWALKLLNPTLHTIAVSSMLNANAAFGSLALELCESIPLYLSSLSTTRTSFNGKRKLNRLVRLIRKFPPASVQIENMPAIYSKCLLSESP